MAKKSTNKSSAPKKNMTKVIIPIKSAVNGSYSFREEMVVVEKMNEVLARYAESAK